MKRSVFLWLSAFLSACAGGGARRVPAGPMVAAPAQAAVRSLLSCKGERFRVDVLEALGAIPDDTVDAQREQLRDWLWAVTLGRVSRRSSASDLFAGGADLPLVRDDTLSHALRLPTGPTRAITTKQGDVVVLVEAVAEPLLSAEVLDAVDEEALSIGTTPARAEVWGYELKPATAYAEICQIGELDRHALESAEHGYRNATVGNATELSAFLSGGVDLLSAQCTPAGLQVNGRRRERTSGAGVTAEDVAGLAQRLGLRYIPPARFGTSFDARPASDRTRILNGARALDSALPADTRLWLAFDHTIEKEVRQKIGMLLQWKAENPTVSTTDLLLSYELQQMFDGRPGFSLDPIYTSADATRSLDELINALPEPLEVERVLRRWKNGVLGDWLRDVRPSPTAWATIKQKLSNVRPNLRRVGDSKVQSFLKGREGERDVEDIVANELLKGVAFRSARQCARYDGPMAGTAVGMTFFYTDLSVKFFARDWESQSPEGAIDGFESVVHHSGSTAWCAEEERPDTRIWFGVRNEGYGRDPDGTVRFAPVATRLFAMGSDPASDAPEAEPPAHYRRFIRWWDSHYGAMAAWEPQYEALNQLLKWSVLIQNARAVGNSSCLGFLEQTRIRTNLRLDRWVADDPSLRWRDAVKAVSLSKEGNECLPLIPSAPFDSCGKEGALWGGVSGATLEQVRAKPFRSPTIPSQLGRLAPDVAPVKIGTDRVSFTKIVRGGGGELRDVELSADGNRVTFKAKVDSLAPQVGDAAMADPRLPIQTVEKTVEASGSDLHIVQTDNGLVRAGLRAFDLDLATVRLEVTPGPVQTARTLAQRIAAYVGQEGKPLQEAAAAVLAPDHELLMLSHDELAIHLTEEQGRKSFLIMQGGGGTRGPPPGSRAGFLVGFPDGEPSAGGGGGRGGDHQPVRVWIVDESHGRAYVAENAGRRVNAQDPTEIAVKERVAARDIGGALRALEARPTTAAAKLVLAAALTDGDFAAARRAISTTVDANTAQDLSALRIVLDEHRVALARSGSNPSDVSKLTMMLAIEQRSRGLPNAGEAANVQALSSRVVAPVAYSLDAGLPPPIYSRGTPMKPTDHYVSRIIDIPADFGASKKKFTVDGTEYETAVAGLEPKVRPVDGGRPRVVGQIGPATRLLGYSTSSVVVVPCSDANAHHPRCREALPPEGRALSDALAALEICPTDPADELGRAVQRQCFDAVRRCDSGSGFETPEERDCLTGVRSKYQRSTTTPSPPH